MKQFYFVLILSLAIFKPVIAQRAYYVSQYGNDYNSGTFEKPVKTIDKLNLISFQPGDSILFEANVVFAGELILNQKDSGRKETSILIDSYGKGRAKILANTGNGILVNNLNGIVIKNINVSTLDIGQNKGFGIKVYNDLAGNGMLENVRIENVEASNFRWAGIYVGGIPTDLPGFKAITGSRYGYKNVHIDSCIAHHNMYYGIYVTATWSPATTDYGNADVTVRNCITYDNTGDSTYTANHSGSGILVDDTEKVLIEYCVSYHNGHLNAGQNGGPCGIWAHCANDVLIQHCESYNNKTNGAADGTGFDLDGGVSNSTIQYCYSHDNDGAGYLMWNYEQAPHKLSGNTIRYCLSVNDGRKHSYGAIHIGTSGLPITNIRVYNNTIIMSKATTGTPRGIWTGGSAANDSFYFFNNLIITDGIADLVDIEPGEKNILFAGNAYWCMGKSFKLKYHGKSFASLEEWRKSTRQEVLSDKMVGLFADPKIIINKSGKTIGDAYKLAGLTSFKLGSKSPLTKNGVDLSEFRIEKPSVDFWGNPIPAGRPGIGAYQVSK